MNSSHIPDPAEFHSEYRIPDPTIKGIVSRDFEVSFLVQVPLDSSDIATPARTGSFFKKKSISCRIFDFSGLGASSFRSERI
jgi:hypothetical protein